MEEGDEHRFDPFCTATIRFFCGAVNRLAIKMPHPAKFIFFSRGSSPAVNMPGE
ncbi:MAG: hypothetical protein NTV56_25805 [Alphaproteobacteria bacterium]|nr:hypothetical protein [Alphaproteobacteria bacterium]